MNLKILNSGLLNVFKETVNDFSKGLIDDLDKIETQVEYFKYYNSVSSVYSSKIEGENIDFDSFFKHKFLNINYQADYTKKADDLFAAYEYIFKNKLTLENLKMAHSILSANLLPKSKQGLIRTNPMFVINSEDRIDYVAAEPGKLNVELNKLFEDIELLVKMELDAFEILYYSSYIHLAFVKIHPFQDGNGRSARLLEKWFLVQKIGNKATAIQLEKNYYINLENYYANLRKLGLDYELLDYSKALPFLLMTLKNNSKSTSHNSLQAKRYLCVTLDESAEYQQVDKLND
jgi:Fic family protein